MKVFLKGPSLLSYLCREVHGIVPIVSDPFDQKTDFSSGKRYVPLAFLKEEGELDDKCVKVAN